MNWRIDVAVQTPAHSALGDVLSYASAETPAIGSLLRVPLGRREVLGVAWAVHALEDGAAPAMELKPVAAVLDGLPPLNDAWRDLVAFAARYYQRSLGEIALAALPPQLRDLSAVQLARRLKRQAVPAHSLPPARRPTAWHCLPSKPTHWPASMPRPAPSCCSAAPAAARPRSTCRPWRRCWRASPPRKRW